MEPYLEAVRREATAQSAEKSGGPLETVYFGGGTPSMMTPCQLKSLITCFDRLWGLDAQAEISIEGHPSTIDSRKLRGYVKVGATRLSMGVESLQAHELGLLGRTPDGGAVARHLRSAKRSGFHSVGVDLMYGIPAQTQASWSDTLYSILKSGPDHLSLYPLQIESKTVFGRRWRQHELQVPEDDRVVEMYHLACDLLREAGYVHYEVANWALPGHECRHNLTYWHNNDFYAVGVSAHAYLRPHRVRNLTQTKRYIDTVLAGDSPRCESTRVDSKGELAELLILGLRLLEAGVNLDYVEKEFGANVAADLQIRALSSLEKGLLRRRGRSLVLEEQAVPIANEVWERFV